ncbi:Methylthioribose-1-phosphate isomerase (Methionine salvage pathway) [Alloalcanivorax dieselolei B5]|uniref:Methylthioribose-1-phosphate isomerase n=1 Tax=Alcanivorax dieselolei (strain DSM 16502 / CGMCC 1.3690 / MCCC 1A00001 / B-5) TaxID=930169 RepID=K0CFK0_ALCDB|nr:S-methyl-5-thioribose-1-phosphate isomerase [Alloalcanivorax dieselolei]AFT70502.1 Methylthioribose-1-phosphate isomerase (Methionine salvage pathway) [Alloalcanivorax dieselolei B5]GGJ84840.1 methylthioribose-1-phosphate isomerase [Alloalcanivorax dieselolei]
MALASLAIRWHDTALDLLDQRALPADTTWLRITNARDAAHAIREMVVRGAPAIGITAGYGLALEAQRLGDQASLAALAPAFEVLAASRPTAVNLFWALDRLRQAAGDLSGAALARHLSEQAERLHRDDLAANRRLGEAGLALLPEGARVYTHCNTGALATGGHGTALGIIRSAWEAGRLRSVYAGETRPWQQGARLTSWELMQDGIPVTLVVDSCAAMLMAQGEVDVVIVGADRIAANGDTANKIGTYSLAVLARHHGIPFIVAAPDSTLDAAMQDGSGIVIEQRPAEEVRQVAGQPCAPADCPVHNPAFDVTPAALISAIVTENGVIPSPDPTAMAAYFARSAS